MVDTETMKAGMMRVWRTTLQLGLVASVFIGKNEFAWAATTNVNLTTGTSFNPATVSIKTGDTVHWNWQGGPHSTTSSSVPPVWDSGLASPPHTFDFTFNNPGSFPYKCSIQAHEAAGMVGTVIVTAAMTNQLPIVTVTNPANNSVFAPPASFSVGASASDPDGTVSQVEFFRNGTSIGVDTTSPYSANVTSLGSGSYTFMAVATDNNNGKRTNSITVVVNTLPSVTVTNPANNTVFAPPASFTVGASASDSDGTVSQVEFFRNGTSIGIDTTSPYSANVSSLGSGTYTFMAVATDNNNGKTTNSISVVVNALPTVAITNPPAGSTFATPWSGPIQASASDTDGSVVRVQFFRDGASLGIVSNTPYSLSSSVPVGAHQLTAVAMDDHGSTNGSTAVSVTVVNPVAIVLGGAARLSASQFRFTHTADPGLKYAVERGSTVTGFSALVTNVAGGTNVVVIDANATNGPNFYRVRRVTDP